MVSSGIVAIVLTILFMTTLARSTLGFGDALIAMPLLTLVVGLSTATALMAFVAVTIGVTILAGNWRRVALQDAWRLTIASLIGIPIGLVLFKIAPEAVMKAVMGVVLMLFGVYSLSNFRLPSLQDERWAYPFGLAAGVLGGAYNTNGPPVVMYAAMRNFEGGNFRENLSAYFFPTSLMILVGHGLAGLWTPTVFHLYLAGLPVILAAVFLGGWMNHRINHTAGFKKAVYWFIVAAGALMVWPL